MHPVSTVYRYTGDAQGGNAVCGSHCLPRHICAGSSHPSKAQRVHAHFPLEAKAVAASGCETDMNMHRVNVNMQGDNALQGRQCPATVLCVAPSRALVQPVGCLVVSMVAPRHSELSNSGLDRGTHGNSLRESQTTNQLCRTVKGQPHNGTATVTPG